MVLIIASSTVSQTSVHIPIGTVSDLIPWIYLSLPLYNHKRIWWYSLLLHPSDKKGYFCKNISEDVFIFFFCHNPLLTSFMLHILFWSSDPDTVKGLILSHPHLRGFVYIIGFAWVYIVGFLQCHFPQLHDTTASFFLTFNFSLQSICILSFDIFDYLCQSTEMKKKIFRC